MSTRKMNSSKKKNKVRKVRRSVIITFMFILLFIIIGIFAYVYIHSNNPIYQNPKVLNGIGTENDFLEKNENNYVNVYYPSFNSPQVDETIKIKVDECVKEFKEKNTKYAELTDTNKADLKIGYESFKVTDDVASVLLTVYEREAFEEEYSSKYYTFLFDLRNDKQIFLSDIFKGRYLNYISSLAEEKIVRFSKDSNIDYEMMRDALCPTTDKFSNFILKDDRMIFYFNKDEFTNEDVVGRYAVEITYDEMYGYFKRGYLECKTNQDDYWYGLVNGPVDDRLPTVVITFDDGPGKNTQKVVDILREHNAVASFFMLGERINYVESDVLMNLLNEGSTINSHSYSHADFSKLTAEAIQDEIQKTTIAVYEATEYNVRFFRPPYGSYNDLVKENAFFPLVLWSVDPRDWDTDDPNVVYENVINAVSDGDVILLHEIHDSTVEALPRILEELNNRGYQIVTIEEMADNLRFKTPKGVFVENN